MERVQAFPCRFVIKPSREVTAWLGVGQQQSEKSLISVNVQ